MPRPAVIRMAAFTTDGRGGNPAGIVLDAGAMSEREMLETAARVGFAETAFVLDRSVGDRGQDVVRVRYFSPGSEIPFCGHATVATAVALADPASPRAEIDFLTRSGLVPVTVATSPTGSRVATLTSVEPDLSFAGDDLVEEALGLLGWDRADLDDDYPPAVVFAGASHLVLVCRSRERLADLGFDARAMRAFMDANGAWATVHLVFPESARTHHVRAVFPAGDLVEDPATGAGAAAYGHYLRAIGRAPEDGRLTCLQGVDMGMPCTLEVQLDPASPRVRVSGGARVLP